MLYASTLEDALSVHTMETDRKYSLHSTCTTDVVRVVGVVGLVGLVVVVVIVVFVMVVWSWSLSGL